MPRTPTKKRKPKHGDSKSNSGKKKKKSTVKGQTTVTNDGQTKGK